MSIIITTFQDAQNLRTTLGSVRDQLGVEHERFEVIVSDGGSTDATGAVMAEFEALIDRVRSEPDRGVYDGMNLGADLATGRWLHFLNAGDVFRNEHSLRYVLDAISDAERSGGVWIVGGAVYRDLSTGRERPIANLPHRWRAHALGLQPHCHQATWVRAEAHRQLGGFRLDLDFVADHEMLLRLGQGSAPNEVRKVLITYLGGGMSEQRMNEIPAALHRNRVGALGLGPWARIADRVLGMAVGTYLRSRRTVGRALGR